HPAEPEHRDLHRILPGRYATPRSSAPDEPPRSAAGTSPPPASRRRERFPRQLQELARIAVLEVDAQRTPAARLQHLEIAARLRREERRESVGLPRDGDIGATVDGDLHEHAVVRPALVQLSRRVQEARPEPERAGAPGCVADFPLELLELRVD